MPRSTVQPLKLLIGCCEVEMLQNKHNEKLYLDIIRQEIINHDLQIKALIQDIHACQGPQEILHELNSEVRKKIGVLRKQIGDLEKIAKEEDKESDKVELLKEVESYRQQLTSTLANFRKANIVCQLTIEKNSKELLFDEGTELSQKQRQRKDKESLVKMSSDVTDHLQSISRHLAETTQRSAETLDTLANSSTTVHDNQDEFKSMGVVIGQSRKLLTKYGRREVTDKVLLIFALAFFFACVAYIVKKRLF